jgi:hypothetical protein
MGDILPVADRASGARRYHRRGDAPEEGAMNLENVINVVILIVVLYIAFRVGAVVLKVLLGLLAIALVVWLVQRLVTGMP